MVLVILDLFVMQAGRQKKEKSSKSKNPKKIQNPKITHLCIYTKDKAYALNPNPKL
tara:strand:+ start:676 stop:843 length:168 start_codon:yes stop_codon:yes gene_type:complete